MIVSRPRVGQVCTTPYGVRLLNAKFATYWLGKKRLGSDPAPLYTYWGQARAKRAARVCAKMRGRSLSRLVKLYGYDLTWDIFHAKIDTLSEKQENAWLPYHDIKFVRKVRL